LSDELVATHKVLLKRLATRNTPLLSNLMAMGNAGTPDTPHAAGKMLVPGTTRLVVAFLAIKVNWTAVKIQDPFPFTSSGT
jgi:hypothetical protein